MLQFSLGIFFNLLIFLCPVTITAYNLTCFSLGILQVLPLSQSEQTVGFLQNHMVSFLLPLVLWRSQRVKRMVLNLMKKTGISPEIQFFDEIVYIIQCSDSSHRRGGEESGRDGMNSSLLSSHHPGYSH